MTVQQSPTQLRRILFAQNAKVIDEHRTLIGESQLAERLDAAVEFASSPDDITPGTEFDAVIAPTVDWLPELLARTTGVRWVHFLSSGVEKIWEMDVDWSAYALSSSKGVHAVPISEYVLGAMLHFAKRFDQFTAQSRDALWRRERMGELTDAEVLIVGAGSIGRAVAERSRFLGVRPRLVARTARTDPDLGEVLGFQDLQAAAGSADYLVVAVPLTPETTGLIDDAILRALKPGAVLIDVSRGGVTPNAAVVRALNAGNLRGAALDVFDDEPLPADSPLWNRENVLLTPHVAGTTPHYMQRALEVFCSNAKQFVSGDALATAIDPIRKY